VASARLAGGLGYPEHAPYDRICVTAACPDVPPPLIQQLAVRGRLIVPVMEGKRQRLTVLEKTVDGVRRKSLADVLYVSLQGRYGVRRAANPPEAA
jgi:protein-L-isoaspartate(D-aspartate) O-methyltransferase